MIDPLEDATRSEPAPALERLARLFETRIAPALERIAAALERSPGVATPGGEPRTSGLAAARRAILDRQFAAAESLLEEFREAHSESPEAAKVADELAEARSAEATILRGKLDASRQANDPLAVLEHRDALAALLGVVEMAAADRDLARWLMMLLMKRMRTGTVREDVATLAARGAESFGHLAEGASLRAALPTLRRSAGLCPRCAAPYVGEEDACDRCRAGVPKIAELPGAPGPPT